MLFDAVTYSSIPLLHDQVSQGFDRMLSMGISLGVCSVVWSQEGQSGYLFAGSRQDELSASFLT